MSVTSETLQDPIANNQELNEKNRYFYAESYHPDHSDCACHRVSKFRNTIFRRNYRRTKTYNPTLKTKKRRRQNEGKKERKEEKWATIVLRRIMRVIPRLLFVCVHRRAKIRIYSPNTDPGYSFLNHRRRRRPAWDYSADLHSSGKLD